MGRRRRPLRGGTGGPHWEDPWWEESPTHRASPPRAHTQHACVKKRCQCSTHRKGVATAATRGENAALPFKDLPVGSSPRAQGRRPRQGHPTCPCLPPTRLLARALLHSSRLGSKPLLTKGRIPQPPSLQKTLSNGAPRFWASLLC